MTLTKKELDAMQCDSPNCTHNHDVIHIHPVCHPEGPMGVCYDKRIGLVLVYCAECGRPVIKIPPAEATGIHVAN